MDLDARSATPSAIPDCSPQKGFRLPLFQWPLVVVVVIWTVVAITLASADRSWVAFGIAIYWGPVVNAVVFLLAGIYGSARIVVTRDPGNWVAIAIVFAAAVASSLVIFGAVFSMNLHGC